MKIVYIYLLMAVTALAAVTSCSKEGAPTGVAGPIDVRLVVSDGNGTRVGSDDTDNYIHQLRVYAFIGDEKVGYAEADNLSDRNYIPMTLSKIGRINFYVIANDKFGPNPQKQKENGTWESLTKSDWESLTKEELESLKFDFPTEFNGWTPINGDFVSPMSNNPCNEFGVEFTGENTNNYTSSYTIDSQNMPATGSLVIPVTVQHVLGRLRLMLNKESDDVTITLTRAEVYHRPDAFRLYFGKQESVDDVISFNDNQTANDDNQELVEPLIDTAQPLVMKPADGSYTTVARTYLAPNQYGSSNPDTYTAQKTDGTTTSNGLNETYRLELTVRFDYRNNHTEDKNYTVYLPQVPRNTSIDVQGTFKGSTDVTPEFNVMTEAWVEKDITIPPFE